MTETSGTTGPCGRWGCFSPATASGPRPQRHGERIVGDSFLLWLHSGADPIDVTLPDVDWAQTYDVALDTAGARTPQERHKAGDAVTIPARSCLLLRATS